MMALASTRRIVGRYLQCDRYHAITLLEASASGPGGDTLTDIAEALGINPISPVRLARQMLAETVDAGSWREARVEAAARIREVVRVHERRRWHRRRP